MKNLPQEQQDRMIDMAQKVGLNAWSSDDKYQVRTTYRNPNFHVNSNPGGRHAAQSNVEHGSWVEVKAKSSGSA